MMKGKTGNDFTGASLNASCDGYASPFPRRTVTHLTVWFCWFLGLCFLFASQAHSHPFHLCVGQMKWNAKSKVWEVSLRLHPQDLEAAINKELFQDGRTNKVGIDDEGFSGVATQYLSSHFFLRRTPQAMNKEEFKAIVGSNSKARVAVDSDSSTLTWIGKEQEKGWLWIHLELTPPNLDAARQKLWFVHSLLIASVERQENAIAIDPVSSDKFSLQFRTGLEFQEMKAKK